MNKIKNIFISVIVLLLGCQAAVAQTNIKLDFSDVSTLKKRYVEIFDHTEIKNEWKDPSYRAVNWFDNEIQIPWNIATAILLGQISRSEWAPALRGHIRIQRATSTHGGANDAWIAMTDLAAGLALNDTTYMKKGVARMAESTTRTFSPRDYDYQFGQIMEDNSYHFHAFAPSMRYGQDHFLTVSEYLYITDGTSFSLYNKPNRFMPEGMTSVDVLFQWFHNFIRWYSYRGIGDPMLYSKLIQSDPASQNRDEIFRKAVPLLLKLNLPSKYQKYIPELRDFENRTDKPLGAMSFPLSTYLSVRRNTFYAGLKLANVALPKEERSSLNPVLGAVNVVTPNTLDRLNGTRDDYYASDRIFNLMTLPMRYYAAAFPEEDNPYGVSGTSVLKNWAYWGVSSLKNAYGIGGQDLYNDGFGERVAWFFFDDEIVNTGSHIWAKADAGDVLTIVNTFRKKDANFAPNGITMPELGKEITIDNNNWLYHDNTGYIFLENKHLKAEGTNGLNPYFVRLSIDHGVNPSNSFFAVVYLPNKDRRAVSGYANSPDVEIVALNDNAHIVREKRLHIVGAAFFNNYQSPAISSNLRGYVLYQANSNGFWLSLYNPYQEENIPFLLADKWGWYKNPMLDYYIHPQNATYKNYEIEVPFKLEKNTDDVPFDLTETSAGTRITVRLRVTRKFEISGSSIGSNQYAIDKASIRINDVTSPSLKVSGQTLPPNQDQNPPSPPHGLIVRKN